MAKVSIFAERIIGIADQDMSIEIPDHEELRPGMYVNPDLIGKITTYDGRNPHNNDPKRESFPAVALSEESYFLWVKERKEWVGIICKEISSNYEGTGRGIDERLYVGGPYQLLEDSAVIIQKTYNRPDIPLEKILTTSPQDLANKAKE